jgi:succinoglycan biosynthesis protein ExoA
VYLGVFRRSALDRVGGFDESYVRNQDYELNWRIRETGGVVYFHPDLEVVYRPRSTLRALARQYSEYGRWKRRMLRAHPGSLRWRQVVPPAALLANVAGLAAAMAWPPALVVPGVYVAATLVASIAAPAPSTAVRLRLPAVFATMHHAWAVGFVTAGSRTR